MLLKIIVLIKEHKCNEKKIRSLAISIFAGKERVSRPIEQVHL